MKPVRNIIIVQRKNGKIEQHDVSSDGSLTLGKVKKIVAKRLNLRKGDDIIDVFDWTAQEWLYGRCK